YTLPYATRFVFYLNITRYSELTVHLRCELIWIIPVFVHCPNILFMMPQKYKEFLKTANTSQNNL
ncbi:MAG: hypothetical protein ACI4S1_14305, partial [Roseburia sp.]